MNTHKIELSNSLTTEDGLYYALSHLDNVDPEAVILAPRSEYIELCRHGKQQQVEVSFEGKSKVDGIKFRSAFRSFIILPFKDSAHKEFVVVTGDEAMGLCL